MKTKLPTTYNKAINKIDKKHERSRQFSRSSEEKVRSDSSSSSLKREKLMNEKLQALKKAHISVFFSLCQKTFNWNFKQQKFEEREKNFVQIYG